ncbi:MULTISPECIES: hypothetical protein [Sphingomonas]|uniref:hypothetical protein n=1 Tax=Sphingomonas TaxID=13687 RepID=UPI0010447F4F|nr:MULTISPECIES: hypothetical protein [Sphingomonas]TCQ11221.1 hypothetical protein C8J40_101609 [Sphingomonas sp. PP-CC-3A-396]
MSRRFALLSVTALGLLAGCTSKPRTVAQVAPPVIMVPVPAPTMPKGASPTIVIPVALADGTYPTPNRNLTTSAKVWHLRAALNVAALACRGPQELTIVAGYNALLSAQKPVLAKAEATYASEYKAGGGDWQDRYDDSMTRLYNFFSQSPARDDFCAAAGTVLAQSAGLTAEALPAFAAQNLPVLERPFTDFYRAVDAWRGRPVRPVQPQLAVSRQYASNMTVQTITQARLQPISQPVPPAQPRLKLDPSVFQ